MTASRAFGMLLCLFPIVAAYATELPEHPPTDWKLTFSDEFHTLDKSRWSTAFSNGQRHLGSDHEKEMYVDPAYAGDTATPLGLNPFSITEDGLTIHADRPGPTLRAHLEGQLYTSGLITTFRSFHQLYGYFEMRAQFPYGRGFWPAFWLLPLDSSWPPEIDVVEILGHEPTKLYTTIHWRGPDSKPTSTGFGTIGPDTSKDFHTYGVLWTPTDIVWYFDGRLVAHTITPDDMRKPMWMLINLAVGGEWPGEPDSSTKFPGDMRINYVKAYALPHQP
jgi:beta-glucanase (GH16 family)